MPPIDDTTTAPDLDALLALATRLGTEAGAFLRDGFRKALAAVESKSTPTDMVSEMDRGAEQLLVRGILAARPDDGILGEEGTERPGTSGVRWVVDPLDGTTNYLYGHPMWCVSIGVEIEGVGAVGVVEAPMLGETFSAARGRGAWSNGTQVAVSGCTELPFALLGTGFAYKPDTRRTQGAVVAEVLPLARDIRRGGSAALDLCFVASGRLDAYWETGLNPWDRSGGSVIVLEAGGVVTGLDDDEASERMTIAGTPAVHRQLRALLRERAAR